jgi:hypothetical protein
MVVSLELNEIQKTPKPTVHDKIAILDDPSTNTAGPLVKTERPEEDIFRSITSFDEPQSDYCDLFFCLYTSRLCLVRTIGRLAISSSSDESSLFGPIDGARLYRLQIEARSIVWTKQIMFT